MTEVVSVLVVGGASSVEDDLQALTILMGARWPGLIVAVNAIGAHLPRLDHWASRHGELIAGWEIERATRFPPSRYTTWSTPDRAVYVDRTLDVGDRNGSSGLFGVLVAMELGADRVVLCGVPMTRSPHFTGGPDWEPAPAHLKEWQRPEIRAKLTGRVRSMSGATRTLLGAPSVAWLTGIHEEVA
jgi:hypothetical protein